LDGLDMLATTTDDLSFEHALKHFWDEALTLHFVLNVWMISKARLDQVLQQKQQELLGIRLLSDLKLV
jgi:urea transporter